MSESKSPQRIYSESEVKAAGYTNYEEFLETLNPKFYAGDDIEEEDRVNVSECMDDNENKNENIDTKEDKQKEDTTESIRPTENEIVNETAFIDLSNEQDVSVTGQEEEPMENDIIREIDEILYLGSSYLKQHPQLSSWKFFIQDDMIGNKVIRAQPKQRQLIISLLFASTSKLHVLQDTIKHEIAHILVGIKENHNEKWKQMAIKLECNPFISCRIFSGRNDNKNGKKNHDKNDNKKMKNNEENERNANVKKEDSQAEQQPIRYKFRQHCENECWSKNLTRRPAGFSNELFKFHCNQCQSFIQLDSI